MTRFIQMSHSLMTETYGGKEKMVIRRSTRSIGAETIGHRLQKKKLRTRTADSPHRCAIIRRWIQMLRKAKACRSARSFSADAAATQCRSFTSRSIGLTVFTWVPRWPQKQPPLQPARLVGCAAIRWRCCHFADTTSGIISSTGSIWGNA